MSERSDLFYVRDIRESIEAIFQYTRDMNYKVFANDRLRYSAVIREFEIIGEAVGKLSETLKEEYSEVPWQDMKDFRNLLIHEYFGVDLEIVWNVVKNDLPLLFETVVKMEAALGGNL